MVATTEEKKVQFTRKNDEIIIEKGKDVSIKSLSDKSSDKLVFGAGYSQDKFAYKKSGNDLVIKYDENGGDKQTVTISGYFTKDGNSKSSLKTIKIGETEKPITELYKNVVAGSKGTMFDDTITSSDKSDKMYGLSGNNTYIFNADLEKSFGNDTVYATGSKDTLTFAENSKLTYTLKGNDVVVTVANQEGTDAKTLGTVTIKDALKSKKNVFIKVGSESEKGLETVLNSEGKLAFGNADSEKALTIKGTVFKDVITGSAKNDKIYTGAGADTITAGKGNDTINITGADAKTINIKDFDGNDIITGIAKAEKVQFNFTSVDTTVAYSKSGNDLVATREFYKKLNGTATTDAKSTETAKQMYVDKDGKLTTVAEGNTAITGNLYQSVDGKYSITKDDTFTSQVYLDKDGKLTTKATEGKVNNTAVNKLYEKDTNYTISSTYEHANEKVTETTTIKDYFKNDKNLGKLDGVTNVAVSGKGKLVGGFTDDIITSSAKNDKMYGLGGNNTYSFGTAEKPKFGNDTVYATGSKDTLTFVDNSELTYTLKGNDVVVTVANKKGEDAKTLGTVTIKDALKSKKNVFIKVGETEKGLETALKDANALKLGNAGSKKALTIKGTVFNDVITGSDKNDKIYTGAGTDTITAGKGNDTINITGAGEKTINIANGDGNDVITGIAKANTVTLSGLTAGKLSYAKSGNDLVITRIEKDAVVAGKSTSAQPAQTATTTIKDYFKDSNNASKLAGVTVDNVAVTGKGKIVGSFKNDVITGSAKADKIYTGAGVDTIKSGKGNDTINITGAGKKTINIANHDGNDVITGVRTDGASVDLIINKGKGDTLSYSKNGASNDLIITRKYTEQLTNKKGEKLYTDAVTGKQTTADKVNGTKATGEFWSKTDGGEIITKAAYDKLASDAKTGYHKENNTVYSYGSGKKLTYSTEETKTNTALNKDYTETTTVKDFFKNGEGASNVTVNGEAINLNGLTISGQKIMGTKYNDVIYGSNKNDVITEQAGNNTFNIGVKGSTDIYSDGESSRDTYNVKNLNTSVDIYDNGGTDELNINVKDMKAEALRYVFDVDKDGAKGDLIITDTKGINSSKFNGVAINDYFTTKVTVPNTSSEGEGATTKTVDHKIETINLNGSSITNDVATSIANITNDVQNFLNANEYKSASDVFDGKNRKAKAELKEIYNSGNNKYNFSTVKDNVNQTVTDKIGDSDIYNVDNEFDFTKDKLVISDLKGENDVLNLAQKADKLTILFDIKKEGASAVGNALYVIGKGQTNLDHGIQMSGIDTIKTSDGKGGYTDVTPADEIVSAVRSWLNSDANKGGYDSVADVIKNASTSGADLSGLISAYAPSTQTPQV